MRSALMFTEHFFRLWCFDGHVQSFQVSFLYFFWEEFCIHAHSFDCLGSLSLTTTKFQTCYCHRDMIFTSVGDDRRTTFERKLQKFTWQQSLERLRDIVNKHHSQSFKRSKTEKMFLKLMAHSVCVSNATTLSSLWASNNFFHIIFLSEEKNLLMSLCTKDSSRLQSLHKFKQKKRFFFSYLKF